MKKSTFFCMMFIGMLNCGKVNLLLREEVQEGGENFYSFSIDSMGKESLIMFDDAQQAVAFFAEHDAVDKGASTFLIKSERVRAEFARRAELWLRRSLSIEFEFTNKV